MYVTCVVEVYWVEFLEPIAAPIIPAVISQPIIKKPPIRFYIFYHNQNQITKVDEKIKKNEYRLHN